MRGGKDGWLLNRNSFEISVEETSRRKSPMEQEGIFSALWWMQGQSAFVS